MRGATPPTWIARTSRSWRAARTTRRRCRRRRRTLRPSCPASCNPAAAWPEELARPGQVHLPERRERLHARHAGAAALLARPPRLQPRLHPPRGSGALRRVGAARQPGLAARQDRRRDAGARPTRVNLKQPLTVVLFYDTVHVNSEGVVYLRRKTSTPTIRRSTRRSCRAIPTRQELTQGRARSATDATI